LFSVFRLRFCISRESSVFKCMRPHKQPHVACH
jgi:hypothetical protein